MPSDRSRYGATAWNSGLTIDQAAAVQHAPGTASTVNHTAPGMANCTGASTAPGRMSSATIRIARGGDTR